MEMYVRADVTGTVFLIEYSKGKIKLLDCDSPSLVKRGLSLFDHTIRFGTSIRGRLLDDGRVLLDYGAFSAGWGHTITPREAYHFACQNAPTRKRFPLRFIVDAGISIGKKDCLPAMVADDDGVMVESEVTITFILDNACRGLLINCDRAGKRCWMSLSSSSAIFLHRGPEGWNEAIRAACTWWEEHRPEA